MTTGRDAKPRRRRRLRRFTGIITSLLVLSGVAYSTSKWAFPHSHASTHTPMQTLSNYIPEIPRHHVIEQTPDRQTLLLIGTDARIGDPLGNADVLCVASIDNKNKRIELLSIPRDTQVAFPDGKYHKINDSMATGGPELTVAVVQRLLGIGIDNYAVARFDGLVHIIDLMGGVTIDVPKNMHYRTGDKTHGIIDLHKGTQHLNGEQALGFVRFRHDALGDIGRTKRQQEFLMAVKSQMLQAKTLPKLPAMMYDAARSMETNLSLFEIGKLVGRSRQIKDYTMIHETLPGSFHDPRPGRTTDLSYWIVNPKQAQYVAKQFFDEGVVQANPIQEPAVTYMWQPPAEAGASSTNKTTAATP